MPPPEPERPAAERVAQELQRRSGSPPDGVWRAPGRANLIGEHTDYNDGFALPFALDRSCWAAVRRRDDDELRLVSLGTGEQRLRLADARPGGVQGWAAYVLGQVWSLAEQGAPATGLDVVLASDVPVGAGLSSSAAVQCAVALALAELAGLAQDRTALARWVQRGENEVVGAPVGLLDQTASLLARPRAVLALDFRTLTHEHVPLDPEAAGLALVVLDTKVAHSHVTGSYAERRAACERAAGLLGHPALRDARAQDLDTHAALLGDTLPLARHVVTEDERVLSAVAALRAGDLPALGPLLSASHASLRDDFRVSCPELDSAVEAAESAGALGARMTGGGFGGSALALVPRDRVDAVARAAAEQARAHGFPVPDVFPVVPAAGAERVA